jgi:hypothetical protein
VQRNWIGRIMIKRKATGGASVNTPDVMPSVGAPYADSRFEDWPSRRNNSLVPAASPEANRRERTRKDLNKSTGK